ncbi:protein takeout-like [Bacillus rossius redtenbacheri]|uniref:protein takeout-like n=1 Tax=Bacillus rossius redtenbacheri TaxID=93214 RepID=UPI002FDCA20D
MKCAVNVAVLAALVGGSLQAASRLPPYLKPCSRSDPELNSCALKNGITAIPFLLKGDAKYHIPVLDPLHLKHIEITQGTGPVKISLALDDLDLTGLNDVELKSVNFGVNQRDIGIEVLIKVPALTFESKYKIVGQVLILPIKGDGDMNVRFENTQVMIKISYDLAKKEDGKEYMKLHDSSLHFKITKAIFEFKNLFNGDKTLGDNMNLFLNENWQEVLTELKPVLLEAIKPVLLPIIDNLFTAVPFDEVLPA